MKTLKIVLILFKNLGLRLNMIGILIFRLIITIFLNITLLIDNLFFSKYKKQEIIEPVFLIGHPRSGTTFLHRFIERNIKSVRTIYLYEMIFPAICARKFANKRKDKLAKVSLDHIWDPTIHRANFVEAETEDVALFFRYFDGFLSWLYFILWRGFRNDSEFEQSLNSYCNQDKFINYLKMIHQKNLFLSKGKERMFSKSFALIFNFEKLKEVYPDGKYVLIIRDPIEAVASFLSLEKKAQTQLNQFDKLSDEKQANYLQAVYKTSLLYYKKVDEIMSNTAKESTILITHKQLKNDFDETIRTVLKHYNIEINIDIEESIKAQLEKQKTFKSKHSYSLAEFGITEIEVRNDFQFIYNKYDV